jgi:hypothetical protein
LEKTARRQRRCVRPFLISTPLTQKTMISLMEDVHVVIFFIAALFLVESFFLVWMGSRQKKTWRAFEVS